VGHLIGEGPFIATMGKKPAEKPMKRRRNKWIDMWTGRGMRNEILLLIEKAKNFGTMLMASVNNNLNRPNLASGRSADGRGRKHNEKHVP